MTEGTDRMPINWRTDYAIRLMVESASGAADLRTVRNLSGACGVPYDYARTIVHALVEAGLLVSRRGIGGGVSLARPAEEIAILDILKAMGEPASLALCTDAGGDCEYKNTCRIHRSVWRSLDGVIAEHLRNITLAHTLQLRAGEATA